MLAGKHKSTSLTGTDDDDRTVTATEDGAVWSIDRKSVRHILTRASDRRIFEALRKVESLSTLSTSQLQRLAEAMTVETHEVGSYISSQGDDSDKLVLVDSGHARVIKTDRDDGGDGTYLGDMRRGDFFGEKALLKSQRRGASVLVVGSEPLRCFSLTRAAAEEVIGPISRLLELEASWQQRATLLRSIKHQALADGLSNFDINDFELHGNVGRSRPVQYVLASTYVGQGRSGANKKYYTIRATSKNHMAAMGLVSRAKEELKLLTSIGPHRRLVPVALTSLEDMHRLYTVYPVQVVCTLAEMLAPAKFDEATARFYAGAILLALDHLHQQAIAFRDSL